MYVMKVTRNKYLVLVPDVQKVLVGVTDVRRTDGAKTSKKRQKRALKRSAVSRCNHVPPYRSKIVILGF